MAMILSRNDPYSQNDMEINQVNQLPMIPALQSFNNQPCFMPYNAGAPSQYGPPPPTQIYPNFPPSCPPEYESKPTSEIVIISNLNADAAEFVPKQRATASLIGETPPGQPVINSGQPIINSNFTNINQLSYQPKIDYIQKNESYEELLPNSNFLHKVPLVQQPQIEHFKSINFTHSNQNWMDHTPKDRPPNEESYYQSFKEITDDANKRERTNGTYPQRRIVFQINEEQITENLDHKDPKNNTNWSSQHIDQIELRQETGLNRKESAWYQRQTTEDVNQKEFRQDKSSAWSNIREDTKQVGQNVENVPHREFRHEKGNANWRNQNEYTDQIELRQDSGSNRRESTRYWGQNAENVNYKDRSGIWPNPKENNKQGGRNIENLDHREYRNEKSWPNQNEHANYKGYRNKTELKHESGSNRRDSTTRNWGKNVDNPNQRDYRQEKSGNWSNYKENTRQSLDNIDHKDHRADRSTGKRLDREKFPEQQQTFNKGDHRQERSHSRRDYTDRDRQNIENVGLKESRPERTLNKEKTYNYFAEKNENKGKLEDNQQESRDNTKVHQDEEQNKYDKKSYVFRNQKYPTKAQREGKADNDFSRKKKYEDENVRRSIQRKNNYPKEQKYNNPRQQKHDSQSTENSTKDEDKEDEDKDRKKSGSEYLESNKSDGQKLQTEKKKYGRFKEQTPESEESSEISTWDEERFKKQQATRNKKQYRKEENGNHNLFEEKKKYRDLKLERDSSFNNSSLQEDLDIEDQFDKSYQSQDKEYAKFLTELKSKTGRKSFRIKEVEQDLFEVEDKYSLAHCVAEDFRMGRGVAVSFKRKFKSVEDLLVQRQKPGGLAVLQKKTDEGDRYIYYLVTKPRSYHKPTYKDFWNSMKRLRDHIVEHGVKFLAVPKLGCGLDRLDWPTIKHIIEFIFENVEIEILYCRFGPNEDTPQRNNYYISVYDYNDKLVDLEEKSVILYFSSVDNEITDEMKEFDEKFKIIDAFKTAPKTPGALLKHPTDKHIICGCIVRNAAGDLFDFKSFKKCIDEINKITKNSEYTGLAMNQIWDDGDKLLHHKVVTMLVHYLRYVDVYVYKEEGDVSTDET